MHFFRSGKTIMVGNDRPGDILTTLPVGNYSVQFHPLKGFYLEETATFELPSRIYGKTADQAAHILRAFTERRGSTGVLLSGEKGSGKSLLAKVICVEAKLPVLLVNQAFGGEQFNTFMAAIQQPVIVLFDEFEKTYRENYRDSDEEHSNPDGANQAQLLTLLDGVFSQRKLFILTCNDTYRINSHMKNRPGRLFYFIEFGGLDTPFIREYCRENLKDQSHTQELCAFAMLFRAFSFDCLQAMVEELNRFSSTVEEAAALLNVKPQASEGGKFKVRVIHKTRGEAQAVVPNPWTGHPLQGGRNTNGGVNDPQLIMVNATWGEQHPQKKGDIGGRFAIYSSVQRELANAQWEPVQVKTTDLVSIDHTTGDMKFASGDIEILFSREDDQGYSYRRFIDC